MELNLKYYNGVDSYSDGDIEDKILKFINKYPNDYEEALKKDSSWPVFYHLSNIRKNTIRWYPFKKNSSILEIGGGMGAITEELCNKCKHVTTIELSKRRATAILERNKNANNLEILVGNFKDIVLEDKYDYILLNGVLEYGALYMDSDNPYEDFINKLKNNLKENGKILIAIENKFGLKYWCGANEDHTNIQFDGLNNYQDSKSKIRTFSKVELQELATKCNMDINFYYMFPDYKFPQIIYTDISLNKGIFEYYTPYYCYPMHLTIPETNVYKEIYDNKSIPFFANSFFVELSYEKSDIEIDFVKFNNYRRKECNLFTYSKKGKYYKKNIFEEGKDFFNNYINSSKKLNKLGYKVIPIKKDEFGYYTEEVKNDSFEKLIINDYIKNGEQSLKNNFTTFINYIKKMYNEEKIDIENSAFKKFKIKISKNKLSKLHFLKKGYIDAIPQNMLIIKKDFYLIDQEWTMDNVPYEFIIYRGIKSVLYKLNNDQEKLEKYLKKFEIYDYLQEFELLENAFQKSLDAKNYNIIESYYRYDLIKNLINEKTGIIEKINVDNNNLNNRIIELENEKNNLNNRIIELENEKNNLDNRIIELENEKNNLNNKIEENKLENNNLKNELKNILNSKSWKLTKPLRTINKIGKSKK